MLLSIGMEQVLQNLAFEQGAWQEQTPLVLSGQRNFAYAFLKLFSVHRVHKSVRDAKKKTPDPLWIKGSENRMDIFKGKGELLGKLTASQFELKMYLLFIKLSDIIYPAN